MTCKYCKGAIGRIRRLVDREFCCHAHRQIFLGAKARGDLIYSARLIRDIEGSDLELRSVAPPVRKPRQDMPIGVLLGIMLAVVLVFLWMPHSAPVPVAHADDGNSLPGTSFLSRLWKPQLSVPSVRLNENFTGGLHDWRPAEITGLSNSATDWVYRAGSVRPGRLRLWAPSLKLTDYTFGFHAAIEKNGLGWAFRATNRDNLYGARIHIVKSGAFPVSNIIHYAVVNGREQDRVELPLPPSISPDSLYHVSVQIRGNRFVTSVNSQVVDTWTDARLRAGGVGFFSHKGDLASVLSVNVTTERSLWDQVFASFVLLPPLSMAY